MSLATSGSATERGIEPTVAEAGLVGRRRELDELDCALSAAAAGSGRVVVVHGEAGIGKTGTVAHFAQAARTAGAVVLWGACYKRGLARPYGPWVEALGGYVRELEPDRLDGLLGANAAVLAELVPSTRSAVAGAPPLPSVSPAGARLRLFDAVASILGAAREPHVLVIDDVQWADSNALDLLAHVARDASRLLIVVIHQGTRLSLGDPLAARLADISRMRPCQHLLIQRLSREESAELLGDVAGQPLGAELAGAAYEEVGGNPLFLRELGRHLSGHRLTTTGNPGAWRLPETVRQAIALRLAGLSEPALQMLAFASVFTAGFGFTELQLLAEADEEQLLDSLDEVLAAELIRPIGSDRYDFAHTVVRHALYDHFSPSRRARLHRRLAEVLERTLEETPEVEAELARQYHASAALPGAGRGIAYALSAARRARAAHAPDQAIALLGLARELAATEDVPIRARIESELAKAQAEGGTLNEAARSLESALCMLRASGASGETIAELVFRVVSTLRDAFAEPSQLLDSLVDRGLAALGETDTLAWARLKLIERPRESVSSGPIQGVRWLGFDAKAVEIARTEGSEHDHARTLDFLDPRPVEKLDELVSLVDGWRTPNARLWGMHVLLLSLTLQHWNGPAAERLCDQFEALATEVGSLSSQAFGKTCRAAIFSATGEFEAATAAIAQARELAERMPSAPPGSDLSFQSLVAELTAVQMDGDWGRAAELMRGHATAGPPPWRFLYAAIAAEAFARAGMSGDARELLGHILPVIASSAPQTYAQNGSVAFAAGAIWELRDAQLAEQLWPSALALINTDVGDWYMTSNQLTGARLATVLERDGQATEFFDRARAKLAERGQRPLCAIVDHDQALARRTPRQPGSARLLVAAQAQFLELGMRGWPRRAAAAQQGRAGRPDGLTARETEILSLLTAGNTNKEIAAKLVLSIHTIERHLQNAYRKIGVRNRADAAAYAVRATL
jgi:DNA-binding CsgD family transcriptional regulator